MKWGSLLLLFFSLHASIDLQNPIFEEGVVTTTEGGVLTAEGIRIQAKNIIYNTEEKLLEAEGDLLVEYGRDLLVGKHLIYNFTTRSGTLTCGRAAIGSWYAGGQEILLCPDGSYRIENAYLTTCGAESPDWKVQASRVCVQRGGTVSAQNVTFHFLQIPFFWIPRLSTNVNDWQDSPLDYRLQYGGLMGSQIGIRYRFLDWRGHRAYLRLDYFFSHGPGIGLETKYCPANSPRRLFTESFIARDRSVDNPFNRTRYRFAGRYNDRWNGWCIAAQYDKLSDLEMASDYQPSDFNLHTARWTQLQMWKQTNWMVANFETRVRLNTFQTINQKLPFASFKGKPLALGNTGILSFNRGSASYLNYLFARQTPLAGFNATRIALHHALYRPLHLGGITLVPGADMTGILYSNSPQRNAQVLATANASIEANARFSRLYGNAKHTLQPYLSYGYTVNPTSRIPEHFIFSINDGYTLLNLTRFGLRSSLFSYRGDCLANLLTLDLFAYAFFDTPTIVGTIPRIYADLTASPTSTTNITLRTAWNAAHNRVDHFNLGFKWTLSEHLAINLLYRYRSPFVWRKADWDNFVLDSFQPERALLASPLSDRRYTFITRAFLRVSPTFSIELETRHGWRRRDQPAYNEGKLSLQWLIGCRWYLTFYVERWEFKKRVPTFGINLRLGRAQSIRNKNLIN